MSVAGREILTRIAGDDVAKEIYEMGYVVVPRLATKAMIDAAWASATAEDAGGVWDEMVEFHEQGNL